MRANLIEIIGTIDQFNGFEPDSKEYKGGEEVDIDTSFPNMSDKATISESEQKEIERLLTEDINVNKKLSQHTIRRGYENKYVLTYNGYLNESFKKRPPQDPDYDDRPRGWNDFDDDEEE